jgi:hypothetical protein
MADEFVFHASPARNSRAVMTMEPIDWVKDATEYMHRCYMARQEQRAGWNYWTWQMRLFRQYYKPSKKYDILVNFGFWSLYDRATGRCVFRSTQGDPRCVTN